VTLTGSGLTGTAGVQFGPHAAKVWKVVSDEEVLVTVPALAASGPIRVFKGESRTASAGRFTFLAPPVAATGMDPFHGHVGHTVTIAGTTLGEVTGVTFGGVRASSLQWGHDGHAIVVTVPAGAATGPLVLVTAGGLQVPVHGGDFTVTHPLPAITAFQPLRGAPGTEVTVTGRNLSAVTEVRYDHVVLPRNRFEVDDDTRGRVRVPDDAARDGVISLAAPGAPEVDTGTAFILEPSRHRTLHARFVVTPHWLGHKNRLDFPAWRRSSSTASRRA